MSDVRNVYLKFLQGRLGDVAYELTRVRYSSSIHVEGAWAPSSNVYRCQDRFVICVDLAGVDRTEIDVCVEKRRVVIRGQRKSPDPALGGATLIQILSLEIDEGRFEREVVLPRDVDPERVLAEQRNGLLWISLPLWGPE